jgi:hypothetical protein
LSSPSGSDDSVESSDSVSASLAVSIGSTGVRHSGAVPISIRTAGFYSRISYRKKFKYVSILLANYVAISCNYSDRTLEYIKQAL